MQLEDGRGAGRGEPGKGRGRESCQPQQLGRTRGLHPARVILAWRDPELGS